jgi:peptidoglycan-associated lipoprotein
MRRTLLAVLAIIAALTFFGCATKKVASAPAEAAPETKAEQAKPAPAPEKQAPAEEKVAKAEAPAAAEELNVNFSDIHFDFDKYDIQPSDKDTLNAIADWLSKNPDTKIAIEGNCDERGTAEYNLALGDKRATAAKQFLLGLGVSPDRIETVSYGKEKPLCKEHTEKCWAENRRDHFVVLKK